MKWDLALAVNGIFDHRKLSVESILAEANSWSVIAATRASALVSETLVALAGAVTDITPPAGVSEHMVEHLQWNVRRLLAGQMIGEPKL